MIRTTETTRFFRTTEVSMKEGDLAEANGLVARFYDLKKNCAPHETLFAIQRRLIVLGLELASPVEAPDPHAPPGGTALAIKAA